MSHHYHGVYRSVSDDHVNGRRNEVVDDDENFLEGMAEINGGEVGLGFEITPQVDNNNEVEIGDYVPLPPSSPPSITQNSTPETESSVADSVSSSSTIPYELNRASDLLTAVSMGAEVNRAKIAEIAASAMDELVNKAVATEPLWYRHADGETDLLNEAEYIREFRAFEASMKEIMRMVALSLPQLVNLDGNIYNDFSSQSSSSSSSQRQFEPDHCLRTEASRVVGFFDVPSNSFIECLMDLKKWSSIFSNIVSRATLLGVISPKVGDYDEMLQVMKAEFHMPTPLVPVRECQFARYCKRIGNGVWGVVDVSLDDVFPQPQTRFRRRPSGCLIQDVSNGFCKVVWLEHMEVDYTLVHPTFLPLVLSGYAFGAKRWFGAMIRYCEWSAAMMSNAPPIIDGETWPLEGKKSLLRLSTRMMSSFFQNSSSSTNNLWMPFPIANAHDFKVMMKSIPLHPISPSTTLAFTRSVRLQIPPKRVFDFLRRDNSRRKWDLLSNMGHVIREISRVGEGTNHDNYVSIMQVKTPLGETEILYVQETYCDSTGYYVVFAPLDVPAMTAVLSGRNPDNVNILASGFVIHPDKAVMNNGEEACGSILTIAFHIIDDSSSENYIPPASVLTMHRVLTETARLIEVALLCEQ